MLTPTLSRTNSTHSETENLELYRRVWRQTIQRLRQERLQLLVEVRNGNDPERKVTLRLMQIAHEMEIYEMCIDRANERLEVLLEGQSNPEREVQRERYLRLMAGLAKASNDAADLGIVRDYFDIGGKQDERDWEDRWENELGNIAASELRSLAGTIH